MSEGRILDLRSVFGVEATVTTSAAATNGAYVELLCTAYPKSATVVHRHPAQEETFRVIDGTLELLRDGRWQQLGPGDSVTVPSGAVHAWRNRGGVPVRFENVHRPALGFEAHMVTLDRLVRAGKIRGTNDIRSVIHMSMSAARHRPDRTVKPPQFLVDFLAFVGRRLGYSIDD